MNRTRKELRASFIGLNKISHLQECVELGSLCQLFADNFGADGRLRHHHFVALLLSCGEDGEFCVLAEPVSTCRCPNA